MPPSAEQRSRRLEAVKCDASIGSPSISSTLKDTAIASTSRHSAIHVQWINYITSQTQETMTD